MLGVLTPTQQKILAGPLFPKFLICRFNHHRSCSTATFIEKICAIQTCVFQGVNCTFKCSVWQFLSCSKNGIEKVYLYVLVPLVKSSDYVSLLVTGKTSEVLFACGKLLLSWVSEMLSNSRPLWNLRVKS